MLKFRSKFELEISEWFKRRNIEYDYEPCKLKYVVPESYHAYTPDWSLKQDNIFYESKGKLDNETRKKLLHIKRSNPGVIIRIIFQNASVKIRKNSKTTYGMWATANGFEWCDFRLGIPKTWLKQSKKQ